MKSARNRSKAVVNGNRLDVAGLVDLRRSAQREVDELWREDGEV